jgi:uncharacterized membrane protein
MKKDSLYKSYKGHEIAKELEADAKSHYARNPINNEDARGLRRYLREAIKTDIDDLHETGEISHGQRRAALRHLGNESLGAAARHLANMHKE